MKERYEIPEMEIIQVYDDFILTSGLDGQDHSGSYETETDAGNLW